MIAAGVIFIIMYFCPWPKKVTKTLYGETWEKTDDGEIITFLPYRAELDGYPGARLHHNARFSISVRKDYWNMKIGTMLMTKIIERAREMKLLNIMLEVVADNKAAIALYHKMGFSDVGIYRNYWYANNAYSDAIVMQKCLDD